jgi:hypothetical protein
MRGQSLLNLRGLTKGDSEEGSERKPARNSIFSKMARAQQAELQRLSDPAKLRAAITRNLKSSEGRIKYQTSMREGLYGNLAVPFNPFKGALRDIVGARSDYTKRFSQFEINKMAKKAGEMYQKKYGSDTGDTQGVEDVGDTPQSIEGSEALEVSGNQVSLMAQGYNVAPSSSVRTSDEGLLANGKRRKRFLIRS